MRRYKSKNKNCIHKKIALNKNLKIILVAIFILLFICIFCNLNSTSTGTKDGTGISIDLDEKDVMVSLYDASIDKIVSLPLEEYVIGVVAAEMPASYEEEALKAQAVAARTFYYYKVKLGGCSETGADVCSRSNHCQAYANDEKLHEKWGDKYDEYYNKIKGCVYSTAGEIITYNGEPIEVLYHASSGGMTEDSQNVFYAARPYLKSVVSENEQSVSSNFYGSVTVSTEKFKSIIEKNGGKISDVNKIMDLIEDITRFKSGRVNTIKIGGKEFTGKQVRSMFSLNSTNFTISVNGDDVTFKTIGYGHGVGMSQSGADVMAKAGSTYKEILTHYYTGVSIVNTK